ncbi:MAG: helix-turn-helix domain-containing protein [Pseudomonadota bacterium]
MLPNNEKATYSQVANTNKIQTDTSNNSTEAQRKKLLIALMQRPMTTIEIRRDLDILGVAPRILELRRNGYNILTFWKQEPTESGKLHRVALYALLGESEARND